MLEFETEIEEIVDVADEVGEDKVRDLIVYNDDYNTFDHVIQTLIKVCRHNPVQAEQCTYIIHHKGRCAVKSGAYPVLKPMREGITDAGIKAAIE